MAVDCISFRMENFPFFLRCVHKMHSPVPTRSRMIRPLCFHRGFPAVGHNIEPHAQQAPPKNYRLWKRSRAEIGSTDYHSSGVHLLKCYGTVAGRCYTYCSTIHSCRAMAQRGGVMQLDAHNNDGWSQQKKYPNHAEF